jgi:hypothetical protein
MATVGGNESNPQARIPLSALYLEYDSVARLKFHLASGSEQLGLAVIVQFKLFPIQEDFEFSPQNPVKTSANGKYQRHRNLRLVANLNSFLRFTLCHASRCDRFSVRPQTLLFPMEREQRMSHALASSASPLIA